MSSILAMFISLCVTVWTISGVLNNVSGSSQDTCSRLVAPLAELRMRDDYWYTESIGAHKLHTRGKTWNDARKTCEEEGGHLAIINSKAEALALVNIFKKSEPIERANSTIQGLVGLHDLFETGEFVTIHGDAFANIGFTSWSPGQPSGVDSTGTEEHCLSMYESGLLNDVSCDKLHGFFCELPL